MNLCSKKSNIRSGKSLRHPPHIIFENHTPPPRINIPLPQDKHILLYKMQSLPSKILLRRIEKKIIFIFQFGHFSIFSFDVGILLSFSISTRHLYNLKTFFRKIYTLLVSHFTHINVKGLSAYFQVDLNFQMYFYLKFFYEIDLRDYSVKTRKIIYIIQDSFLLL